jgi:hypothetical protein
MTAIVPVVARSSTPLRGARCSYGDEAIYEATTQSGTGTGTCTKGFQYQIASPSSYEWEGSR